MAIDGTEKGEQPWPREASLRVEVESAIHSVMCAVSLKMLPNW